MRFPFRFSKTRAGRRGGDTPDPAGHRGDRGLLPDGVPRGEFSDAVIDAMSRVDREAFVPASARGLALADTALPIGHGQTISQPYVVAYMTDLLDAAPGERVLEIGTGSGYQAAVLAELGVEVFTVEVVPELAASARLRLHDLGYRSVHVRAGNGREGWPEHAPYPGIIVTAATQSIPPALLDQLATPGRLVLPLADDTGTEWVTLVRKDADGHLEQTRKLMVRFVPLIGA